jgi:hypothetical protein
VKIKGLLLAMTAASAVAGFVTTPAQALTCYEVAFDHSPNAYVVATPPRVVVDDGNPHVRSYPC